MRDAGHPGNAVGIILAGDNLEGLRALEAGTVKLVYLDPPFNSGADYRLDPSRGGAIAFTDVWRWDDVSEAGMDRVVSEGGRAGRFLTAARMLLGTGPHLSYLTFMAPRLQEMHRVLSLDG